MKMGVLQLTACLAVLCVLAAISDSKRKFPYRIVENKGSKSRAKGLSRNDFGTVRTMLAQYRKKEFNVLRKADRKMKLPRQSNFKHDKPEKGMKPLQEVNRAQGIMDYLFEGDIMMTPEQLSRTLKMKIPTPRRFKRSNQTQVLTKRKVIPIKGKKWPNPRAINYYFAGGYLALAPSTRTTVRNMMNYIQARTCLRFKPKRNNKAIRFVKDYGCWSYVGYTNGNPRQDLSIGSGCERGGIISHEIMHALGFFHEQARKDRDTRIRVVAANIIPGWADQFGKTNTRNIWPYEYGSNMHYDGWAVSKNKKATILAKNSHYQYTMGYIWRPSFLDIMTLNWLYCVPMKHKGYFCKAKNPCYRGGYLNPNKCTHCICPEGWAGNRCQFKQPSNKRCNGKGKVLNAVKQWRTLSNWVGKGAQCIWAFKAPPGKRVQIRVQHIAKGVCVPGCVLGGLEFKHLNDYRPVGPTYCCPGHNGRILKSRGRAMPMIARGLRRVTFKVQYRFFP